MPESASGILLRVPPQNGLRRLVQRIVASAPLAWAYARIGHLLDGALLRLSRGRWTLPGLLGGLPILTLTSRGARSGQPRRSPLIGIPDGDSIIVIATNFGQARHPAWYYNLRAHPEATITVGVRTARYLARKATADERERYWRLAESVYAGYAIYRRRAGDRSVPIIVLTPAPP